MKYTGGCHCGAVRFEVEAPEHVEASECNCSICSKSGYLHLIVPASRFKLVRGAEQLTTYTFNTGTAKHTFCMPAAVIDTWLRVWNFFATPGAPARAYTTDFEVYSGPGAVDIHIALK